GSIAGGVDSREVRFQPGIRADAPAQLDPRAFEEPRVQDQAQAGRHELTVEMPAARRDDAGDDPVAGLDAFDFFTVDHVDAVTARDPVDEFTALLVQHPVQEPRAPDQPRDFE